MQVTVECRVPHTTLYVLGSGFATFMGVMVFGPVALLFLAIPLTVLGIGYVWMRASTHSLTRRGDPDADYLVGRIEAAVAGASPMSPRSVRGRSRQPANTPLQQTKPRDIL